MVRTASTILGIGLLALFILGIVHGGPGSWLVWLDGLGCLCAFAIAASADRSTSRTYHTGAPIALGVALFVLWILGLSLNVAAWLTWGTFAIACAFLALGLSAGVVLSRARPPAAEGEGLAKVHHIRDWLHLKRSA